MERPLSGYLLLEHFRLLQKVNLKPLIGELSSAEFWLLGLIYYRKKPVSANVDAAYVSDLISASKVTAQAISKMLNHLEDKGLILRLTTPTDRRTICVRLTDEGERRYLVAERNAAQFLTRVKHAMGEENVTQMFSLMKTFHQIAETELKAPSPSQTEIPADDADTGA